MQRPDLLHNAPPDLREANRLADETYLAVLRLEAQLRTADNGDSEAVRQQLVDLQETLREQQRAYNLLYAQYRQESSDA